MKHIVALLIKYVMVAVVLWIILGIFTDLSFASIMYLSITVTLISYIIGDLLILSVTSNLIATIADILIAAATIYLFNFLLGAIFITFWIALVSAVILGAGEWIYHKFIHDKVLMKGD